MQRGLRPLKNMKFFTGTENYEESNSIPDDKFYSVQNGRFVGKVISSKLGWQAIGNLLMGGTKINGIYEIPFWNGEETINTLICFYNKQFNIFNEVTQLWDPITTSWPNVADVYTDGVIFNNSLYIVNPLEEGSEGGTGAKATATITADAVTSIAVNNGGKNYNSNSVVILSGGGGSTATAIPTIVGGVITAITITGGGAGYTSAPTVFITSGASDGIGKINLGATGTGLTATSTISGGQVDTITVTNEGAGYVTAPDITLVGGGGTGATAQAIMQNGVITAINILTRGEGYTTAPTVQIEGIFSVVHGTVGTPRGTMIASWVERLFVAGDRRAPNAWIASKPALATNPLAIEDFDTTNGAVTDLVGTDGVLTAIRVLNTDMYMFKVDSIYSNSRNNFANGMTQFTLLSRTGGATNQKSTIVVENDVWFYDPVNNQIRSLGLERNFQTDPRTKALTEIIKRSMNLLDRIQDNPVMSYNKRVFKLSVKTIGSPTNNFTIVFDYNTGGFSIDRGQAIGVTTIYNGSVYYGEDGSGQAFKDDTGYAADGAPFVFRADTGFQDDGRPDLYKRSRYIYFKGKQSYDQDFYIRLYRNSSYSTYSDYYIPSPRARGVSQGAAVVDDGTWGSQEQGNAVWGGAGVQNTEIPLYKTEELISVSRISNLYALGLISTIYGGRVVGEQMVLKVIDENENYKRSDI